MRRAIDEQRLDAERARPPSNRTRRSCSRCVRNSNRRSASYRRDGRLPRSSAPLKGWPRGTATTWSACGGDLGLIVVDIAGHGATEGILALRCKELLRASLAADVAPGDAVEAAAEQLGEMGPEVFLTAFVAVVNTEDGSIRYANAGHPPAFISSSDADIDLDPTGPLVGPFLGATKSSWRTSTARMSPGDNLCAYTDGVIEIRNADNEFFGPERLRDLIRRSRRDDAPAIVKRCLDEAQSFSPGRMRDDATIVVLCRAEIDASSSWGSPSEE